MKRCSPKRKWMLRASPPVHKEKRMNSNRNGTMALELVLACGFVGIPLAWGVAETIMNAIKLFQ